MDEPSENSPQNVASDPSASQTSTRRVADPGEIEELQRAAERVRRKRRHGLVLFWVMILIGAAVAIYALTARSLVRNARQKYREVYRNMDLVTYRAFNPSGLQRAEALYRETEAMNSYLQTPAILKGAGEALQLLRQNYDVAQQKESRFEQLREKYNVRRQEARDVGLPELLPDEWARLRALEASFRAQVSPAQFNYRDAEDDLEAAVQILDSLRGQYADLREYARVRDLYRETVEAMNLAEWEINKPRIYARLMGLKERAETYAANQEWGAATMALQQFRQLREDEWRGVTEARSAAEDAMEEAQSALVGTEADRVRRLAEDRFEEVRGKRQRMEQAFLDYQYAQAEELAAEVLAQMRALGEELGTLQRSREALMDEFRRVYDEAVEQEVVFRRNWPERWDEVEEFSRRIRTLAPDGGRQLELIKTLEEAIRKVKDLVELARNQARQAFGNRTVFEELVGAVDMEQLNKNFPKQYEEIMQLRVSGQNWWDQRMFPRAATSYAQATQKLQETAERLTQHRERAEMLREAVFGRLETYARGLEVFRPRTLNSIQERRETVIRQMADERFVAAVPELEAMQAQMPDRRFLAQDNGTVMDFVTGLMWGGAPEVASSARSWYNALTFADELGFANYSDWRLPTRDELAALKELPAEQRQRLFPTLGGAKTVWTSENVARGGDTAYAVEMKEFEVTKLAKTEKALALPLRSPVD